MPRGPTPLFRFCAAVSALVFVLTIVLWIRSAFPVDAAFERGGRLWIVVMQPGYAYVATVDQWPRGTMTAGPPARLFAPASTQWERTGCWGGSGAGEVVLGDSYYYGHCKYIAFGIRFWLPALASALFPTAWVALIWQHRRQRRRAIERGLCLECGYDLRATTSGRCPECGAGTAIAQPD